jgi:predicted dehydrogenase
VIRIGVVGCGEVANFGHLPAIVSDPSFELAALFDPNEDRLSVAAAKFGSPPTFKDLPTFYRAGLDAVLIASPAPTHREHVLYAATQGVHVLCEKPISDSEAEAKEMAQAMAGTGKIFTIGFCYRFSPVSQQIRDWVKQGVIGTVRSLRLIYIWNLHGRYEPGSDGTWIESPRWRGRMVEGGPMVDCGVHCIDLARMWLGKEPVRVHGEGAWVTDYEAPDHMYLHMDHEGGAHTMVEMSFTYGHTAREPISFFSYHLIGDGGVIRYDRDGYILEAREGKETVRASGASEKNFPGMYAEFAKAIQTGDTSGLPTAEDGIIATQIAWEATQEAINGRRGNRPSERARPNKVR